MSDNVKVLAIDLIVLDKELQGREAIDPDHIADLRAALKADPDSLPPIRVFFDGSVYWLSDGFHRWHAANEEKRGSIKAEVIQGSKREAWMDSLKANQGHGLRRSNATKRRLVEAALNDVLLVQWSDNKIAEHIGVTHPFVGGIRKQLVTVTSSPAATQADKPRVGKDGTKRQPQKKPATPKTDKPKDEPPKISGGVTFDVAEIEAATEAEAATPVGKLFSKLLTMMGQAMRLVDDINRVAPHKLYGDIFESMDCANKDIEKWKAQTRRS